MPRELAKCGTTSAYRRHLRRQEPVDEACRAAKQAADAVARAARRGLPAATGVVRPIRPSAAADQPVSAAGSVGEGGDGAVKAPEAPVEQETGHISRVEVLKEMLQDSRDTVAALKRRDPARVYLALKEQREILAEIAVLQGNGQVKGVSLADQLAAARAARAERAAGA